MAIRSRACSRPAAESDGELASAAGEVTMDPHVALACADRAWEGLPMALCPIVDRGEMSDHVRATPVLLVARSGTGQRWYRSGAVKRTLTTAPRMIEIYGAGFSLDHARWEGTRGDCVGVEFPATLVARLLRDDARPFNPATQHEVFDDQLTELVFAMWQEAATGSANGRLFAEGLSLALLGLLSARYAAAPAGARAVKRLSAEERRCVQAFIDSGLEDDLSVEQLASAVDMSPFHFSRVFKTTFGRTPHRFVLERRIEAASAALRKEPERPIADIALAFGFATQAHFTEAFRRRVGATPGRWRRSR